MALQSNGDAAASPLLRADSMLDSEKPNMMVLSDRLGSEDAEGVPLKRGPLGFFFRMVQIVRNPEVRVWLPVLGKLCLGAIVLSAVAFVGHMTQRTERYGEEIADALPSKTDNLPQKTVMANSEKSESQAFPKNVNAAQLLSAPLEKTKGANLQPSASGAPAPCISSEKKPIHAGVTADGKVILNEANAEEMTQLPAVGPSRAEAIVKLRTRLGQFRKVSDLLRVRGIGWKTLRKMKEKIVLNRPASKSTDTEGPQPAAENTRVPGTQSTWKAGDGEIRRQAMGLHQKPG